jgi:hypothetical protein
MVCNTCYREVLDDFEFCSNCGGALNATGAPIKQGGPTVSERSNSANREIHWGTFVLGGFAVLNLLAGIGQGLPPISLLGTAGWVALAWYWQSKKRHSEVSKGVVAVLATVVAIGEIASMVSGADRFKLVRGAVRFDTKTAQNCWAGGPRERGWDHGYKWQTINPPHIPTCDSLRHGEPVMADSIFVDVDKPVE